MSCLHTEVNRRTVGTNLSVSPVVGCALNEWGSTVAKWATVVHDCDFCAGPNLLMYVNLKYNLSKLYNHYIFIIQLCKSSIVWLPQALILVYLVSTHPQVFRFLPCTSVSVYYILVTQNACIADIPEIFACHFPQYRHPSLSYKLNMLTD